MTSLPLAIVLQLAAAHAPQVAPETISTFALAESAMNPYALFDNTTRRSHAPRTAAEAAALARTLLDQGHSIDTGLMQINSKNFALTGLTHVTAFDPAESVRAGAMILTEAYQLCSTPNPAVDPLRCMASRYNTGRPLAGEKNGYVARIYAAAERLVPAIRAAGGPAPPSPPPPLPEVPPHACGPPPPSWDGWAAATHKRCIKKSHAPASASETDHHEVHRTEKSAR